MKLRLSVIMAAVLVLAAFVTAGTVNLNNIGADAAWFSHFDMQKFDGSAMEKLANSRGLAEKCEKIKTHLGLDPIKDITGVTVYGSINAPQKGVVIVNGTLDVEKLSKLAQSQSKSSTSEYEGLTIIGWKGWKGEMKSGCFYDANTLVMSKDIDSLKAAIDVLAGKAKNISKGGCITSQDAILQVYMADASSISDKSDHLMFLANVKKTLLAIGQKDSDVFSELIMQADNADNALLLNQMIQGLLAMGQMQAAQQNAGALEALKKFDVSTEDTTVVTSVVLTVDEIDQMLSSNKMNLSKMVKSIANKSCDNL